VVRAEPARPPVRVERREREFGQTISVPGPGGEDAATGSDANALRQQFPVVRRVAEV